MNDLDPVKFPNIAAMRAKEKDVVLAGKKGCWSVAKIEAALCRTNHLYWVENYGYIMEGETGVDAEVGIVKFVPNEVQIQILEKVYACFVPDTWTPFRGIVLKFRQAGISTLFASLDYWFMRFRRLNAFVIADLARHTDNIFRMIQLFHDRDECGVGIRDVQLRKPDRKPMPKNKTGMYLSNGSMLELDSGEGSNPGTSQTLQIVHCSESSKWRDPENAETSLFNTVPRKGFSFIVKESTAFDISTAGGAKYAKDCDLAQAPGSKWAFVFIKWYELANCREEVQPSDNIELTNEERDLMKVHRMEMAHIKFRRKQLDLLGGSVDKFRQEFPSHPQEPFLVTGSYYFDLEALRETVAEVAFLSDLRKFGLPFAKRKHISFLLRKELTKEQGKNYLRKLEKERALPKIVAFSNNEGLISYRAEADGKIEEGCALMFREPEKDAEYIVTIDAAEGKKSSDYVSDNSVIEVFHTHRREQVLEWAGTFDEEMAAKYAVMIGSIYNKAQIVIEMNNKCGGMVAEILKGLNYHRLYYRQKVLRNKTERELGWHTSSGNKQDTCAQLRLDFKNGNCILHSVALLEEMMWFTDKGGKLGAAPGHNDDRVMASAIALKVIQATPALQDYPGKRRERDGGNEPQIVAEYEDLRQPVNMADAIRRFL